MKYMKFVLLMVQSAKVWIAEIDIFGSFYFSNKFLFKKICYGKSKVLISSQTLREEKSFSCVHHHRRRLFTNQISNNKKSKK